MLERKCETKLSHYIHRTRHKKKQGTQPSVIQTKIFRQLSHDIVIVQNKQRDLRVFCYVAMASTLRARFKLLINSLQSWDKRGTGFRYRSGGSDYFFCLLINIISDNSRFSYVCSSFKTSTLSHVNSWLLNLLSMMTECCDVFLLIWLRY